MVCLDCDRLLSVLRYAFGAILVLVVVLLVFSFMSLPEKEQLEFIEEVVSPSPRFYCPDSYVGAGRIIVDRETGVCYLWHKGSYAGGLTVLVDSDGKPVIWVDPQGGDLDGE